MYSAAWGMAPTTRSAVPPTVLALAIVTSVRITIFIANIAYGAHRWGKRLRILVDLSSYWTCWLEEWPLEYV